MHDYMQVPDMEQNQGMEEVLKNIGHQEPVYLPEPKDQKLVSRNHSL